MTKNISIRDLRYQLSSIADEVEQGASYTVIRFSRPCFKIVPIKSVVESRQAFDELMHEA